MTIDQLRAAYDLNCNIAAQLYATGADTSAVDAEVDRLVDLLIAAGAL